MKKPFISIIIPTLDEEKYLEKCLKSIKKQTFHDFEMIVVDGGSRDNTIKIAKKYADKVLISKKGIGHQQNMAVRVASGEILFFTQADTILNEDVLKKVHDLFEKKKDMIYGNIVPKYEVFDVRGKLLNKLLHILTYAPPLTWPTAGMGLFIKKEFFEKVNGFKNVICEDIEIGLRLRKKGKMGVIYDTYAISSARRFIKNGYLKTLLFWLKQYFLILLNRPTPVEKYSIIR